MRSFFTLILVLMLGTAYGQSNLPACQGSDVSKWSNCLGTANYLHDEKYIGEWSNGKANGQGTMYFGGVTEWRGDKYIGEFKDNLLHGKGTYFFLGNNKFKGDVYIGEYKHGKKSGYGTYLVGSPQYKGDKYVGEMDDNTSNGQGTYYHLADNANKGDKYVGEHQDGKRTGQGTYSFTDGRIWLGEWVNFKINGKAIWYNSDGTINKSGIFKDNVLTTSQYIDPNSFTRIARNNSAPAVSDSQRQNAEQSNTQSNLPVCQGNDASRWSNCFGSWTFSNGDKYVGEFEDGKYNGQGTYTEANGNKYAGEFKDGVRNGQGTYIFSSGEKYIGDWKDNKYNGQGNNTNILGIGNAYFGEFRDGIFNGQGIYTFTNGDKYVGEWKDGKINGLGIKYSSNGNVEKTGVFKDNVLTTSLYVDPNRFTRIDRSKITPMASDTQRQESDQTKVQIDLERLQLVEERRRFEEEKFQLERQAIEKKVLESEKEKNLFSSNPKLKEVLTGKVRFDCVVTCSFKFGYNRGQLKSYYDSKNWTLLAEKIYDLQQQSDLSYYYLAQASEGLGYPEAALIYYNLALHDTNKCKGLLNVCDGFNFPNDINLMVAVIQNSNTPEKKRLQEKPSEVIKQTAAKSISNLSLKVSASDPDLNGIVTISIQTNTDTSSLKINGDELGGKPDGSYSVKRVARVGQETKFTIAGVDVNGNTDTKIITVTRMVVESKVTYQQLNPERIKRQPERDAVAVIIGISNYKSLPKADFAKDDAQVFYDYAIRALGVRPGNIKLLMDEQADAEEIYTAFKTWLPARVKSTTDVYVFYSGHGLPTQDGSGLYWLPQRANRDVISKTAILLQDISSDIQAAKPKSVTIFMDACYSGQARGGETLVASARPIALKSQPTSFPSNFTLISASQADQISSSSPDLQHGIFSYYLMRGMEGEADLNKDGKITLDEIQVYLSENVGRQARIMNRQQEPQVIGDGSRVLVGK